MLERSLNDTEDGDVFYPSPFYSGLFGHAILIHLLHFLIIVYSLRAEALSM